MNIVQIEDYFHPDAGYQINILSKYMVKLGHKVTIITSEMNKIPEPLVSFFGCQNIIDCDKEYTKLTKVEIYRLPLIGFVSGRAIFTNEIYKVIKKLDPDVLYIHGNDTLTAMRILMKIKKLSYPIIMDSHMLEMASVNKFNKMFKIFYKTFFAPKIIKNMIPIIRTQDDSYVEKYLGIPLIQCPWISVGSDTPINVSEKSLEPLLIFVKMIL